MTYRRALGSQVTVQRPTKSVKVNYRTLAPDIDILFSFECVCVCCGTLAVDNLADCIKSFPDMQLATS